MPVNVSGAIEIDSDDSFDDTNDDEADEPQQKGSKRKWIDSTKVFNIQKNKVGKVDEEFPHFVDLSELELYKVLWWWDTWILQENMVTHRKVILHLILIEITFGAFLPLLQFHCITHGHS